MVPLWLLLAPFVAFSSIVTVVKKGAAKQYDDAYRQKLAAAVTERLEKNTSYPQLAKAYGLTQSTIYNHVQKQQKQQPENASQIVVQADAIKTHGSHNMVFSYAEERHLADHILQWHDRHMSLEKTQVSVMALKAAIELYPNKAIVQKWRDAGAVGENWMRGFTERHPDISLRIKDQVCNRRNAVGWASIQSLYDTIVQVVANTEGLEYTPDRIYNLDETSFMPDGPSGSKVKVFAKKGAKHAHGVGGGGRQSITILPTIRADGQCLPPLLIYNGTFMRTPRWWGELASELKGTPLEHAVLTQQVSLSQTKHHPYGVLLCTHLVRCAGEWVHERRLIPGVHAADLPPLHSRAT